MITINTCTVKKSMVAQTETTSMCTVNISDHEEQHINKIYKHHIVSSKTNNPVAALSAGSRHQKPNQILTKKNINYV